MSLNAAVIGLGVGESHLKCLIKNNHVKKIKIFDKNLNKTKKIAKKYKVYGCKNINEIFEDKSIHIVCIASNDDNHSDQVHKCLKKNKHVFVEKPAFINQDDAKKAFRVLKKKTKIFFASNHILRESKRFQKLKKLINNKFFGKIYYFEGDYNYGRINKIINGWRGKIKNYSITLGGGIHLIDLSHFLLNEKIIEVKSYSNNLVTSNTKFRNKDCVVSIIKFKNNIIGKITSNFGCVYPHFHKLSIYGTKKTFENYIEYGKIFTERDKNIFVKLKERYKPTNKSLKFNQFLNSIIFKKNRNHYLKEVFDCLSVCFAIDASIKNNKTIKVKYLK